MKLINDLLYMEFADMIACGVSEDYIKKAKYKGYKSIAAIEDPEDRRKAIYKYEDLAPRYKEMIALKYGNPYQYMASEPIKRMIQRNIKAEQFYIQYRFENGQALSDDHVEKYSRACSWLDMLLRVEQDKSLLKKQLGISITTFYENVISIIKAEGIYLPTSYKRLRENIASYKAIGFDSLIEKWRFNNTHAGKVCEALRNSVLLEMIADDRILDDVFISKAYNTWAGQKQFPAITPATVGNYRKKNAWQLQSYREGNRTHYNNFGKHIIRTRASAPLLLVGSDGNNWDMYFRGMKKVEAGGVQVHYYKTFVLVVVMDAFNDYVLGWAKGDTETAELIKDAYLDAMQHIKHLTGEYYLPHQLQTDRFALKSLEPFYKSIDAEYFPAAARSPRGKYIERFFGDPWHAVLQTYPNYSGRNVTAKKKINPERIEREKGTFPVADQAHQYAIEFIERLRLAESNTPGLSKQEEWLQAFKQNDLSRTKHITDEQFLYMFGIRNTKTQTITNRGIQMQLNNRLFMYSVPDSIYLDTVGKKAQIIYDPYDFSRVLVTDGNKIRFIAETPEYIPAARADFKPGDKERFWKQMHLKKQHSERIIGNKKKRDNLLAASDINPKALLQAGILEKGLRQMAEIGYTETLYNPTKPEPAGTFDPLDLM